MKLFSARTSDLPDATLKRRCDAKDPSPTICRCQGAPAPLEPAGPHCARCRRLFSAGLRIWLTRRAETPAEPLIQWVLPARVNAR